MDKFVFNLGFGHFKYCFVHLNKTERGFISDIANILNTEAYHTASKIKRNEPIDDIIDFTHFIHAIRIQLEDLGYKEVAAANLMLDHDILNSQGIGNIISADDLAILVEHNKNMKEKRKKKGNSFENNSEDDDSEEV